MKTRARFSLFAFVVLATATVFGEVQAQQAAGASGAPEVTSLTLVSTSDVQIGGPWVIAREEGYYTQAGFKNVEVKLYSAVPAAFPAFVSGQVDIMSSAEQPMITLVAGGKALKVVGIYSDMTGLHGMIANSSIKVAKDLEGKTVGVQKGSPLEWYTRNFCRTYGCDLDKVKLVNMPAQESVPALATGTIDAYAGWQPFIGRALEAGKDKGLHMLHYGNRSLMKGSEGPRKLHTSYAILYLATPFLEKNPRTVDALLRVLERSLEFIKAKPQAAAKILAKEYKITEKDAADYIAGVKFGLGIDAAIVREFQGTADLLYSEKLIKAPVNFASTALDVAPLKRVLPQSVTYTP
jgi:NitT/TauT family transport system substrate-binding protein